MEADDIRYGAEGGSLLGATGAVAAAFVIGTSAAGARGCAPGEPGRAPAPRTNSALRGAPRADLLIHPSAGPSAGQQSAAPDEPSARSGPAQAGHRGTAAADRTDEADEVDEANRADEADEAVGPPPAPPGS